MEGVLKITSTAVSVLRFEGVVKVVGRRECVETAMVATMKLGGGFSTRSANRGTSQGRAGRGMWVNRVKGFLTGPVKRPNEVNPNNLPDNWRVWANKLGTALPHLRRRMRTRRFRITNFEDFEVRPVQVDEVWTVNAKESK